MTTTGVFEGHAGSFMCPILQAAPRSRPLEIREHMIWGLCRDYMSIFLTNHQKAGCGSDQKGLKV